jgi:predicted ATPase/DNA-binding SARP family transcriptional activator
MLEFRILGPLEVLDQGRRCALGSPRQRALLAVLLLDAGHVVSVDALTESLWPEDPPASARHALEVYVSRLRKQLHADGRERLETRAPGYVLHIDGDTLDAQQFEVLIAQARTAVADGSPAHAAELLGRALELWRGEPLADVASEPFARAAAGRLEELKLTALEDRIDAELALGQHAELVARLEALVHEHPLRERPRGQLMLALYRSGRQADALAAYRAARRTLRDELGLDPGNALQSLERDILNHEPRLDLVEESRSRVPAPVTPLIGRGEELARLAELVCSTDARLVTLTGTGGIGKSRLALEAAHRLCDRFIDGAAYVELAHVRGPELVAATIAGTLGLRERPGTSAFETLKASLRDQEMLVVLDNFEHVLDAAPLVSDLLTTAARLRILVTSRSRLRLYGEHELPLSPLRLPSAGDRANPFALSHSEAVELFVARAQQRKPGFVLDVENGRAVADICLRLEGLPLSIELAAGRLQSLMPDQLLERLDERLPVLVDGPRDVPARQRSLRATIEWSYGLLDDDERRVFRSLSIFVGGCTLEAVDAVCGGDERTVESLVENSLVRREGTGGRISMLETIREYAQTQLAECGEKEQMHERHAAFFVELAERAEPELRAPAQLQWLARLDAEQANLSAAFGWALDTGRFDVPLRLGAALWRYWEARGSIADARRRLDDALARSNGEAVDARAAALFASGRIALRQGDLEHAQSVFDEARTLFGTAGAKGGTALCTAGLSWIAHILGPAGDAVPLAQEAVALARESGEEWIVADALNNLGVALRAARDLRGSQVALEESLALRRRIGDLEGVTAGLNGLGLIAIGEDDFERAEILFREAFAISERRGDLFYDAAKDVVFGYIAFGRGDRDRATMHCVRALESCRAHGYQQFAAYVLETLAGVAAAEGRLRQAGRLLGAAVAISDRLRGAGTSTQSSGVEYDWEARAVKRVLDDARRALGPEAWEAAVDEGRALDVDEAIAYAAEWTAQLPADVTRVAMRSER